MTGCARPSSCDAIDMMLNGELRSKTIEAMRGVSCAGEEDKGLPEPPQSNASS